VRTAILPRAGEEINGALSDLTTSRCFIPAHAHEPERAALGSVT
jgi:hypothetical protein